MKNYFFQNQIAGLDYVPQGYVVSENYNYRMTCFVPLSDEQEQYFTANPTANALQVYYVGNVPQPEIILPTLEERKQELKDKFKPVQELFTSKLSAVDSILGNTHNISIRLRNICRVRRDGTITTIDSFTTIEQAMLYDIRDSDAAPMLYAIDIIESNTSNNQNALNGVSDILTQIEEALNINN
jgi:hypothetical protein